MNSDLRAPPPETAVGASSRPRPRCYLVGWKEYFRHADTPRVFRELGRNGFATALVSSRSDYPPRAAPRRPRIESRLRDRQYSPPVDRPEREHSRRTTYEVARPAGRCGLQFQQVPPRQSSWSRALMSRTDSLGEYNALQAAGALSLEQGLRLVQRRGELDIANANSSGETVITGVPDDLERSRSAFEAMDGAYQQGQIAYYLKVRSTCWRRVRQIFKNWVWPRADETDGGHLKRTACSSGPFLSGNGI